jgi:hypothetical protein
MLEKWRVLRCLMSLKINFLNLHLDFFPKVLVQWVRSKGTVVSTKTLRDWKEDTSVGGMLAWWWLLLDTTFQKPHISGRATYAASPSRENDSTRPLNKI